MPGLRSHASSLFFLIALALAGRSLHAAAVDAQQACAAPAEAFMAQPDSVGEGRRNAFIALLQACRAVSLAEMVQIEQHYPQLPDDSQCRELGEEFREALDTLDRIERTAAELPLATEEDRLAAETFYRLSAPGLSRAVAGLFILHYGICREEIRAPLSPPSSNATISIPDLEHSPL